MFAVLLTPRAFSWSWRVQHWHWPHLTDVSRGLLETNLDPVHHDKHWWKDVRSFIHLKTVYMECIHVHVYIYIYAYVYILGLKTHVYSILKYMKCIHVYKRIHVRICTYLPADLIFSHLVVCRNCLMKMRRCEPAMTEQQPALFQHPLA